MQNWAIDRLYAGSKNSSGFYDMLEQELTEVNPGSDGLIVAPWLYGEQFPIEDTNIRCTFFNVLEEHSRAHIVNAVREGVCYSIFGQIGLYHKDTGKKIHRLGANGGGSLSDQWMQIMADVAQLPVYVPKAARHSGAIGVAMAAAVGLGVCGYDDIPTMVGIEKEFEPRKEHADVYREQYRAFDRLYTSLKGLYSDMNGKRA
jgi:xylulokinase